MADAKDFEKLLQDAMAQMRPDPERMKEALKGQAAMGEEFGKAALQAASKSADLSAGYARETLKLLGQAAQVKDNPAAYGQALQEFAQAQGKLAQEQAAAFAQLMREFQEQTVGLAMKAGQDAAKPPRKG